MNPQEKFYTGVGSRETPVEYLEIMTQLATYLNKTGWILRSGGSWGADEAFQKGVTNYSNIFLPKLNWRKGDGIVGTWINDTELVRDAMYIVSKYDLHEDWEHLINGRGDGGLMTVNLHTRNVFQVLGANLKNPSKFLVCYTNDGAIDLSEMSRSTGGTRTAMRLACHFNVPIFNLKRPEHKLRILNWIEEMKEIELKKNNKIITDIKEIPAAKRSSSFKMK